MEDKAGDDQRLTVLQAHHCLRAPSYEGRYGEAEQANTLSVVGLRDLGLDQQFDIVAADDGRNELDRGAVGFENDRRIKRLRDYNRDFAAG